jgi:predicted lysophospholipase L1 biosynthesis ABC-type transport system permease subunit
MGIYWSSLAGEASPGLTLAGVAALAALPPYKLLRQSSEGRARSAIGYLSGFLAGLVATAFLAVVVLGFADRTAVVEAGVCAAFFGPFIGMVRAKWDGPRKSPRRIQAIRGWPH